MSTVLVIGDTHCPAMKRGYVRFLQQTADRYQPDRIVHIGDLVDWHAISYHERNPDCRSAGDEYRATRKQVQSIVKAFPKADILIGNHDALPDRQAMSVGLPSEIIKSFKDQWDLPWRVTPRHEELMIDDVVYRHLDTSHGPSGSLAALNYAKGRFRSTAGGHWHSECGVLWYVNDEFRVFGLATGCGVDRHALQLAYGKPISKKPMLGCGVVIDGKYPVSVPWCLKSR